MTNISDGLYKTDDGAAIRFYDEAVQNNAASERCGRAIFDTCLMAEVITPGSRESYPVFELERVYAEEVGIAEPQRSPKYFEYERQVTAYRGGAGGADLRGTALSAWPAATTALVATCQHAGIFTVEGLASLPENRFTVLGPGARQLVERAKAFLAAAEGNAPTEALAAENVQLRSDVERLSGNVAELSARLETALALAAQPPVAPPADPAVTPPPADPAVTPPKAKAAPAKAGGGNALAPII